MTLLPGQREGGFPYPFEHKPPREYKSKTLLGNIVEEVVDSVSFGTLGERAGKAVDEIFNSDDSSKS